MVTQVTIDDNASSTSFSSLFITMKVEDGDDGLGSSCSWCAFLEHAPVDCCVLCSTRYEHALISNIQRRRDCEGSTRRI